MARTLAVALTATPSPSPLTPFNLAHTLTLTRSP